jgi:hypothetical protein
MEAIAPHGDIATNVRDTSFSSVGQDLWVDVARERNIDKKGTKQSLRLGRYETLSPVQTCVLLTSYALAAEPRQALFINFEEISRSLEISRGSTY